MSNSTGYHTPAQLTALPTLLEFLAAESPRLVPRYLEAVRHLPSISEGPVFAVRKHIRAQALGRTVVAKIFNRSISPSSSSPCTNTEFSRLLKEIKILNFPAFLQHENIVNLESIEFGILSGNPFELCPILVLEDTPLGSLDIAQQKPVSATLPWSCRKSLCLDMASGLQVLHNHGILHGDLHPSHVLLFPHNQRGLMAKLTGFGKAENVSSLKDCPGTLGTAPWRAPEVQEGSTSLRHILKTDVFSLGLLFWSVLSMKDPFTTLDLPLDPAVDDENTEFMFYLFRAIPLLIEHALKDVSEENLNLLNGLFKCTVRVSPRNRDLDRAVELLTADLGTNLSTLENGKSSHESPNINFSSEALTSVSIGVSVLQELPTLVAMEYTAALSQILETSTSNICPILRDDISWTLFLCHLYGYGARHSVPDAVKALQRSSGQDEQVTDVVNSVTSLLSAAFRDEVSIEDSIGALVSSLQHLDQKTMGPWLTPSHHPLATNPLHHGINIKEADLRMICLHPEANSHITNDLGGRNTLLHAFAMLGLCEKVSFLLETTSVDIDAKNALGETALFLACRYGHVDSVRQILDYGADASIETDEGENGLHWLCSFEKSEMEALAKELQDCGANLGLDLSYNSETLDEKPAFNSEAELLITGKVVGNPLLRAVANRDEASLVVLIRLCVSFIVSRDQRNYLFPTLDLVFGRPLRLASELHLADMILALSEELQKFFASLPYEALPGPIYGMVLLLGNGEVFSGDIYTAITKSAAITRAALTMEFQVPRLAYHGAEWKTECRRTLEVLLDCGFITNLVLSSSGPTSIAAFAVRCGNEIGVATILDLVLTQPNDINKADVQGYTLVHHALESGQLGVLKVLAEKGADFDLRKWRDPNHVLNEAGASYLHVLGSLRVVDRDIIQIFFDQGVPATIRDGRGISALSMALTRSAFTVARALIENGASLQEEGRYGVTQLGDLFVPGVADQYDDLFSTLEFLLQYENLGVPLFIAAPSAGYNILHVAARHVTKLEWYPKLLARLLRQYGKPEHLEACSDNAAKSTPLLIAVGLLNFPMVKALVDAGASLHDTDNHGRTPLRYAREIHIRIVHDIYQGLNNNKSENLEQIVSILILLAEKSGGLDDIDLPTLNAALDRAQPLLQNMMQSEHRVAYMRKMEDSVMAIVTSGYNHMTDKLDIAGLDLLRRIIMRRIKPSLVMTLEHRVLPSPNTQFTRESYSQIRSRIPWLQALSNRDVQQFQQAAAFEWFLDLVLTKALPATNHMLPEEGFEKYVFSRDRKNDLKLVQEVIEYPFDLLDWYENIIKKDNYLGGPDDLLRTTRFVEILRSRDQARVQSKFPLPPFDQEFRDFHFDTLQISKLDMATAARTFSLVLRCRCYYDDMGWWSRFDMMRMCQRMASIDDETWDARLLNYRKNTVSAMEKFSTWKEHITGLGASSGHISTMEQLLLDTKMPESAIMLAHPRDIGDFKPPETVNPVVLASSTAVLKYAYHPLDTDKRELRFLRLLPPPSENHPVECNMEQHSISPQEWTREYHEFMSRPGSQNESPHAHHQTWQRTSGTFRYRWGDFACLSHTWGKPDHSQIILIDGQTVNVSKKLEEVLRSLSMTEAHKAGLLIWVDALCINQDDIPEKEKLVHSMDRIYRDASSVTVWLGPHDDNTAEMVQNIKHFVSTYSRRNNSENGLHNAELFDAPPVWYSTTILPALMHLFDRPYWRRLWIMQEISVGAPCERFYIGNYWLSWGELVLLLRHHMKHFSQSDLTDEFTETDMRRVMESVKHAYALVSLGETYRHTPGLGVRNFFLSHGAGSNWIYLASTAQVTDTRDRVYGLLGLLSGKITSRITVQYTISVEEVFRNFSIAVYEGTGSLDDILLGGGISSVKPGGCSWAINLNDMGGRRVKNANATGSKKDRSSVSEIPSYGRSRKSSRARHVVEDYKRRFRFSFDKTEFTMFCLRVDSIDGISGNVPRSGVDAIPWVQSRRNLQPPRSSTTRQSLLKILYADTQHNDEPDGTLLDIPWFDNLEPDPPMVEQLINCGWWDILRLDQFRTFHHFRLGKGDFIVYGNKSFKDYFPTGVTPCEKEKISMALDRIRPVIESTFITTASGRLGSTSVAVMEKDEIFIVPGCSYPVIMRRDEGHYRVVGACFIDGMMEGEGLEGNLDKFEEIHCR